MQRIATTLLLSLAFLLVAATASAEVTRLSFEALDSRDVHVELRNGERVEGELRVIAEEAVVLLTSDGEVREFRYAEIAKLRVARVAADAPASTEPARSPTPPRDDASTAGRTDIEAPELRDSNRYIPDAAVAADAHARAAAMAAAAAREQAYADELVLNEHDYLRYRSMVSSARVKRIVGWSIASVGALILVATAAEKLDAEQWGRSYDGRRTAAAGFILGGIGTPFIIWGRSQHKSAERFAEASAVRRPYARGAGQYSYGSSTRTYSSSLVPPAPTSTSAGAADAGEQNTSAPSPTFVTPEPGDGPYDTPQAVRRTLIETEPPREPDSHAPTDATAASADDDASAGDADSADDAVATDSADEETANGEGASPSSNGG